MAKLSKKSKSEEVVNEEVVTESVVEETVEEEVKSDIDLLKSAEVNNVQEVANTERLKQATSLLSKSFNLDDTYRVNSFNDKGKVIQLGLENKDFIIQVTIKDGNRHGFTFNED